MGYIYFSENHRLLGREKMGQSVWYKQFAADSSKDLRHRKGESALILGKFTSIS